MSPLRLTAYASAESVKPGERIELYASAEDQLEYRASVVRLFNGEDCAEGPGFRERACPELPDRRLRGRHQPLQAGSYVLVPHGRRLAELLDLTGGFTVQVRAWPTTPERGRQALVEWRDPESGAGFSLSLGPEGAALTLGLGDGGELTVAAGAALVPRTWTLIAGSYSPEEGTLAISQWPLATLTNGGDGPGPGVSGATAVAAVPTPPPAPGPVGAPLLLAAAAAGGAAAGRPLAPERVPELSSELPLPLTVGHYNGKLEAPKLAGRGLAAARLAAAPEEWEGGDLVAAWDFGAGLVAAGASSIEIADRGPGALSGYAVNLPTRGVTGSRWSGEEHCYWRDPEGYAAIHFHDDDLDDARWHPDLSLGVPAGLPSGVYAFKLEPVGEERSRAEYVPFCVSPAPGGPQARIVFLLPTATHLAYGNDRTAMNEMTTELQAARVTVCELEDLFLAEHPEYGDSCYGLHSDGSGICFSTRLRPLLNWRPLIRSPLTPPPASVWGLAADLHVVDWLEARGFAVDVVTDLDLHRGGSALLEPYDVLLTGAHPEYASAEMMTAIAAYQANGGRLMYLGGNGFYWVTCFGPGGSAIEVRRGKGGMRPWTSPPGEGFNAFDGRPGGTWEERGLRPSRLTGLIYTAAGMEAATYYRRTAAGQDAASSWIFAGVEGETFGEHGLHGGGAAGIELDRADLGAGLPPEAVVLASSEGHSSAALEATEAIHFHTRSLNAGGDRNPAVRADVVWYPCPNGGAVFSVGSVAWAASLSSHGYENDVSRITENVLRRFLDPRPLEP